jgi:hypothetical protein
MRYKYFLAFIFVWACLQGSYFMIAEDFHFHIYEQQGL